jgi:hypothetical protein
MTRNLFCWPAIVGLVALVTGTANAGTFAHITIDDSYGDWAGIPVLDSDGGDNSGGPDIGDTQIANDNNYLYIRNTFPNNLALGTFLSIDVDENTATGFDIFGLGLIGSEVGWQNDFPFTQSTGVFNDGMGMSGDYFGSGAALLAPYADTASRELAISLAITRNVDGSPVFPDNTITLMLWTDQGQYADVTAVIHYTLAVPEPSTSLLVLSLLLSTRLIRCWSFPR